jgi:polysaccharide biosynthesis protein PslG
VRNRTAPRVGLATLVATTIALTLQFANATPSQAVTPAALPAGAVVPSFGVNFHAMWTNYTDAQRIAVLDKLAAAHVKWVRVDIGWSALEESCQGCFASWYTDILDTTVNAAAERGIKVLGTFWMTPHWASGGGTYYGPPNDPADYARAARWIASRYRGKIAAWEIWNEPNEQYFWDGSVQQYFGLLKAAYPAFKAGDPNAQVVLGGPDYNDTGWLGQLYRMGAKRYFDVLATHPYQGQANDPPEAPDDGNIWRMTHVAAVHALMQQYGDAAKPIWWTEFGWSAHPNSGSESPWDVGVTPQQQADFLTRSLALAATKFPYVKNVFWYNERNTSLGAVQQDSFGLLTGNLAVKPAYTTVKTFLSGVQSGTNGSGGTGGGTSSCTVRGTANADVLRGTPRADVICAGAGDDVIYAAGGNDVIYAGKGADTVYAGDGADAVRASAGDDAVYGGSGADRLSGEGGNDLVLGGLGPDQAFGGIGTDRVQVKDSVAGNDGAFGGLGTDSCVADQGDTESRC